MFRKLMFASLGVLAASTASFLMLRAGPALSRDDTAQAANPVDQPGHEVLESEYQARLALNDAAADRWRGAHGTGAPAFTTTTGDERTVAADGGCPEGTQVWLRDRITELCAPLCSGDQDCGPEDGRCRILDAADTSEAPPKVLIDDVPPDELDDWLAGTDPRNPPVMVCDPFWDVEGALDADLVAVAE
ncbi:MAG: hypothetical protein HYS27_16095 [Deltaproteobacteria bacterium]|nr:hypothetical protein [Deltaproteobacteria bacterium]